LEGNHDTLRECCRGYDRTITMPGEDLFYQAIVNSKTSVCKRMVRLAKLQQYPAPQDGANLGCIGFVQIVLVGLTVCELMSSFRLLNSRLIRLI